MCRKEEKEEKNIHFFVLNGKVKERNKWLKPNRKINCLNRIIQINVDVAAHCCQIQFKLIQDVTQFTF